ncbi:LpqB family beta-propeller domain-containing protein [Kineococcus glutinatus]|uniref:LpqB family beta-propeller domain-containing protein n=1 Tax=Kineococcus glutinatus TaxID=1070872 RepID=UPI0031E8D7F3
MSGPRLADDPRFGLLQVIPEGPVPGATPVQVVSGFLRAGGTADDDHAVARSFLTAAAAERWLPDASTTVCAQTPSVVQDGADAAGQAVPGPQAAGADAPVAVVLDAEVVALVDGHGRYEDRSSGSRAVVRVVLRRERGQWRIDELPDGILISALDASRTFRAFPLSFAAADGSLLVPEVRWFAYGPATATRIVRELLAGPSPWLAPAVVTGAPPGTRLRLGSVPVAGGVAVVELTDGALATTPQERRLLLSQLRAVLGRLPGVEDVRVTVRNAELSGPSPGGDVPTTRPRDERMLVLTGSGVARYDGGELRSALVVGSGAADLSHPAVSPVGGPVAFLAAAGRQLQLQQPGGPAVVALTAGSVLLPPSVDPAGWVWTGTAAGLLVVRAAVPAAAPVAVQGPAEGFGGAVTRVRVSRDGTRAVVVTTGAGGAPAVAVHGVQRDERGRPLRLAAAGPVLAPGVVAVLDAAWLGADHVALLVRRAREVDPRPVLAQVGGPVRLLPPVPGAVSVAAGEAERGVAVGTADGRVLVRSGADWVPVTDGRYPAYPG